MKECGIFQDVITCVYRLVHNSTSLIVNMTNNNAESYNSIVCKFAGGKRINFALKGSYETRCEAAAISYNSKGEYYRVVHKAITAHSPSKATKRYIQKIIRRRDNTAKRRLLPYYKNTKSKRIYQPDEDYGPLACTLPGNPEDTDMPALEYKTAMEAFLMSLQKSNKEKIEIEVQTRGQSSNLIWKQKRSVRITASNFGKICKLRPKTPCVNTVKALLYSDFVGSAATRYGIEHEPIAKLAFESQNELTVSECGLFIGWASRR